MTYFIEQYRNVDHPDGKVLQTTVPMELMYLEQNLKHTKETTTLKTIAVWIIKPKKIKPSNH